MNVVDSLKHLPVEEIKSHCTNTAINAAVAMMHVSSDFNLSTVLRNANFFGFKEVFYIGGKKSWDRRGAVGTQNYTDLLYFKQEEDFLTYIKDKYTLIAVENNIPQYQFKTINLIDDTNAFGFIKNPVFMFGEEQLGIPDSLLDKSARIVTIPCYGSVRSVNVGTASGIVMGFYRKYCEEIK